MHWFLLAIITALSVAARDVSVKTYRDMELTEIAALELFWALPLLATGWFLVPVPNLDTIFWLNFGLSLPLNIIAYILYLKAIRLSPLSLCVPFLAFTPVFMLVTGALILNESVNLWGGIGIGLIVTGSYILNFNSVRTGLLTPFTALWHEKGSWFMLLVAFIFSINAVIGKKAILHSSPLFFIFAFFTTFNLTTLLLLLISGKARLRDLGTNRAKGVWLGLLLFVHFTCHGLAIVGTKAVYVIAVKRTSILFTVLLSWIILHEGEKKARGLGTIMMFSGALLITLLG